MNRIHLAALYAACVIVLAAVAPAQAQFLTTQQISRDTVANLQAINHGNLRAGALATVTDPLRGGQWKWTAGDQSAQITADTLGALWVAPTSASTGASGAWQRVWDGKTLQASWFGVICDYNGTTGTNNTAPMRALDAAIESAKSATVVFDAGATGRCLVYASGDTDASLWDLSGPNNSGVVTDLKVVTNGVKFETTKTWSGSTQVSPIVLRGIRSFEADGVLDILTQGSNPATQLYGVRFVNVFRGIQSFDADLKCEGGVQCLRFNRLSDGTEPLATHNFRNVRCSVTTKNTFYPLSTEEGGENINCALKTENAGRSWIGSGMRNVVAHVDSTNPGTTNDVLWSATNRTSANDAPFLEDVKLTYVSRPRTSAGGGAVTIRADADPSAVTIKNLDIDIRMTEDATNKTTFPFILMADSQGTAGDADAGNYGHVVHFKRLAIDISGMGSGAGIVLVPGAGADFGNAFGNMAGSDVRFDELTVNVTGSTSAQLLSRADTATYVGGGSVNFVGQIGGFSTFKHGSALSLLSANNFDGGAYSWTDSNKGLTVKAASGTYATINLQGGSTDGNFNATINMKNGGGTVVGQIASNGSQTYWFRDGVGTNRLEIDQAGIDLLGPVTIDGTTTNNNAAAGDVGEYIEATANITSVALTNNTMANLASISLSAGDWTVGCTGYFSGSASAAFTRRIVSVSTTSATLDQAPGNMNDWTSSSMTPGNGGHNTGVVVRRLSLGATTTAYCVGYAIFTDTATGGARIWARRER